MFFRPIDKQGCDYLIRDKAAVERDYSNTVDSSRVNPHPSSVAFDLYSAVLFCLLLRSIPFSPSDLFFLVLFTASSHSWTVTSLCIHRTGVLSEGLALLLAFTISFFSPHTQCNQSFWNGPVPELKSRMTQKSKRCIRGSVKQRLISD